MDEKIQGIEEVRNKNKSGEVTDSARDAIMQAALNKAGKTGNSDQELEMEMAEAAQAAQTQETQQVDAQKAQEEEEAKAAAEKAESPEKIKANETKLTSAIDLMALNNLNNLMTINNPMKVQQENQNTLNDAMMKAAMNTANPTQDKEKAESNMATVSQGTTAASDSAKKDSQSIEVQQTYETGASTAMQEAKDTGLSLGVKIEAPDATEKQPATEHLLANSMEQLATNNLNDLSISSGSSQNDSVSATASTSND